MTVVAVVVVVVCQTEQKTNKSLIESFDLCLAFDILQYILHFSYIELF